MTRENKKLAYKPWSRTGTERKKTMIQELRIHAYDRPRVKHWDYVDDDDDFRDDDIDWDDYEEEYPEDDEIL